MRTAPGFNVLPAIAAWLACSCASPGETASTPGAQHDAGMDAQGDVSTDVGTDAAAEASADAGEAGSCASGTCLQVGAECGQAPDGCGSTVSCGDCGAGLTCGGGGPNKCGTQSCQPKTCSQLGAECGIVSDGCSSTIDCGACSNGTTCNAQNKCSCNCSLQHATATCTSAGCVVASCDTGYGDCNTTASDGCESDLNGDPAHCGGCANACTGGKTCQAGTCGCDATMPSGWPSLTPWDHNPALVPTPAVSIMGADNVYAPDIHAVSGALVMFYGAQGGDGHDRIHAAWSSDGAEWRKYPSDQAPQPVLDHGTSNHVNDPSVVQAGGTWRMYYTDAPTAENDLIWLAESTNLVSFHKVQQVLGTVPGTWESDKVGRPSVLLEGGVYKMWYDGSSAGGRHVGFASSTDGVTFTRHTGNPIFMNAGAIDVKKVGGVYVMVREAGDGTYWATSVDGLCWVDRGKLFGLSGQGYDAYGQVTPFLQVQGDSLQGVWFGGASVGTWNKNRIAVAWAASPPSGGGCTGCTTAGWTCSSACQSGGGGAHGTCGAPGSVDPGTCCACKAEGCEACTGSADCHAACIGAGHLGGWCAVPGSSDPGNCCGCI